MPASRARCSDSLAVERSGSPRATRPTSSTSSSRRLLRSGVDPAFGDGEDPEPLRRPPIEPALQIVSQLGRDVAALEQQLGGALDGDTLPSGSRYGCLPLPVGVERHLEDGAADARGAWVVARLRPQGEQECAVDRVAGDAKPVAVVDERRRRGENTRLEDVGAASAGARVDVRDTEAG